MSEGRFTKIAVYIIVAIMLLLFFSIGLRFFTRVVLIEKLSMDNAFTRAVMFDNKVLAKPSNVDAGKGLKTRISDFSKEYLALYTKLTECAKAYDHTLGWTIAKYDGETIVTLDENYHVGTIWKMDIDPFAENICDLHAFLQENDLPFLYAALPGKVSRDDTEISGVIDFSNQNYDAILNRIKADGVEVLDLRENMEESFADYHAQFFATDHHWKPRTGLWAAGEIAKYLNEVHGYDFDLTRLDRKEFESEVHERILLGTYGRKLTLSVAQPEDLELLYPKYPVDLSIEIPSRNLHESGDFSVYYSYPMLIRGDFYHSVPYSAYMYGDLSQVHLTNNNCENEKSVLVIGDSMDNTMLPFLSLGIKQITAIDVRAYQGSLREYILQHKDAYDMVIVTNSVISLIDPNLFDFS